MASKSLFVLVLVSLFLISFVGAECVDDDLEDYSFKGTTTATLDGQTSPQNDSCAILSWDEADQSWSGPSEVSFCLPMNLDLYSTENLEGSQENACILEEKICTDDAIDTLQEVCENGCNDGACFSADDLCSYPGLISNLRYCDIEGYFKDSKSDGESCANDYECRNQSCTIGLCQSKYVDVRLQIYEKGLGIPIDEANPNNSLIDDIFDFIWDRDCNPVNQNYYCEGTDAFLCGVEGVWESKGQIPGICDYEEVFNPPVTSPSSRRRGGSSSTPDSDSSSVIPVGGTENSSDFSGEESNTPDSETVLIDEFDGNVCGDGKCGTIESSYSCGGDCSAAKRGVIAYYISLIILILAIGAIGFLLYQRFFKIPVNSKLVDSRQ